MLPLVAWEFAILGHEEEGNVRKMREIPGKIVCSAALTLDAAA
jgi:hypothetical protein